MRNTITFALLATYVAAVKIDEEDQYSTELEFIDTRPFWQSDMEDFWGEFSPA